MRSSERAPDGRHRGSNGGRPRILISSVRQAIWSIDRNQPLARIQTMEEIVGRQLSTSSQSTPLLSAFALLALLLASLGLYGVLRSTLVRRDTAHERDRRAHGVRSE